MSEKEQFYVKNLINKINNFTGEFSNNFKKEIIDAINLLDDRNAQLEELISAKNVEIQSKNAIIATLKISEDIKNSEQCEEEKPLADIIASFVPSFLNQNWSLPDSLIYYMTKNPATSKYYQKVVKSCKYFFIKNPTIIVSNLIYCGEGEWLFDYTSNIYDVNNILSKLWITDGFFVYNEDPFTNDYPPTEVSSMIPKIFRCDAINLGFSDQILSYNEFLFLTSNTQSYDTDKSIVKDQNGKIVELEKLVEALPKLKEIRYTDSPTASSLSTNTIKELLKLPQFLKTDVCDFYDLPESYIQIFFNYAKENKYNAFGSVSFRGPISEANKNRLEEINSMNIMDITWDI